MDEGFFLREFELNKCNKTLTFHQKEVGDVSCVVWDAALVLAKYLEKRCSQKENEWLRDLTIVELGAGLGCVGLTAACLGANVTMTDLPEVMPLLQKNIEANKEIWSSCGGKVRAVVLDWGSDINGLKIPDVILLADCVYYEESVEPLVNTLLSLADTNTEIIISQEERDTDKQRKVLRYFLGELEKHFKVRKTLEEEQHPEFHSPDIMVLSCKKKFIPSVL